jgi:pimeloyl-ACP methyl ester carboxylesterase
MDYIAQGGYEVYLMDVRGYGRSTRPPEMAQPARENRPIAHTDVAVKDFGTVVDHILSRRGVPKINLLAWSWGTTIAGAYAAPNNDKVERLVLYAPVWLRQTPSLVRVEGPLAYSDDGDDAAAVANGRGRRQAEGAHPERLV